MSCDRQSGKVNSAANVAGTPSVAGKGGYLAGWRGWLKRLRRFFRRSSEDQQNTPIDYASLPQLEPANTPNRQIANTQIANTRMANGQIPRENAVATAQGQMTNDQGQLTNAKSQLTTDKRPMTNDKIRLTEAAVDLVLGVGEHKRLVRVDQAFAVWRGNRPTGMALTPAVMIDPRGQVGTSGCWGVTHIDTGQLIAGDFTDIDQAEGMATLLADFDWTQPFEAMSKSEINEAKRIIEGYRRTLKGPGESVPDEDLTGQLVSDGFGDIAFVIEDHGPKLVLANPRDGRYVMPRNMAGPLTEEACRDARLARPIEPANGVLCAGCNLPANDREVQAWHAIDGKPYCQDCSREAAKEAGCTFAEDWEFGQ